MIKSGFLFLGLLFLPAFAFASVRINEIMYDLEGSDSVGSKGREWVEIFNDSSQEINLSSWKFNDGDSVTNHGLNEPAVQGSMTIPPNGYVILAVDAPTFLSDHQNYNDTIIDILGVNSLNNTTATLKLIDNNGNEVSSVTYDKNMGAAGDGNSLQYVNGNWIAAVPTPGAANAGSSQPPSEQQSQSQSSSSSSNSSPYIPPEKLPKIKAYAGEDKNVVVGASAEFRGQGFGLEDEPLDSARFLWTFGDGSSKEGKNITHIYQYPGDYIVALNISSGEYSASDYMLVKAIPNQVFISEIKIGESGWLELENKSKEEIDISGCQIKYDNQSFIFPQSTRIRPNTFLVISSSVLGINLLQGKGIVELLYPGGFKADSFSYNGFLQDGQSFNRTDTGSIISPETPGIKNSALSGTKPTPGVGSNKNIVSPAQNSNEISEKPSEQENDAQSAKIITVGDNNSAKSNTAIYLIAVGGLILFAGGAILFIRRKRSI